MSDDLLQQAANNAPVVGASGVLGGGGIIAVLKLFRMFATPQDVELAEARLRAEFAEKYMSKEALQPLFEDMRHIRDRVDQLFIDKK